MKPDLHSARLDENKNKHGIVQGLAALLGLSATDELEGSTNNDTRVFLPRVTEPLSTPGLIGKVAALMKDSSKFHVPIPSDTKGSLDKQVRVGKCENSVDHLPYIEVSMGEEYTVPNSFKRFLEDLTGEPWDWWAFATKLPATETSRSQDQKVLRRSRPEPSTLEHL